MSGEDWRGVPVARMTPEQLQRATVVTESALGSGFNKPRERAHAGEYLARLRARA